MAEQPVEANQEKAPVETSGSARIRDFVKWNFWLGVDSDGCENFVEDVMHRELEKSHCHFIRPFLTMNGASAQALGLQIQLGRTGTMS